MYASLEHLWFINNLGKSSSAPWDLSSFQVFPWSFVNRNYPERKSFPMENGISYCPSLFSNKVFKESKNCLRYHCPSFCRYSFAVLSNIAVYVIFFTVLHLNKGANDDMLGPADENKFEVCRTFFAHFLIYSPRTKLDGNVTDSFTSMALNNELIPSLLHLVGESSTTFHTVFRFFLQKVNVGSLKFE